MFAISSSVLLISLAVSGELLLEREFRREQETTLDDTVALLQSLCRQERNLADLARREIPRELRALHFHVYHVKVQDEAGHIWVQSPKFPELPEETLRSLPIVEEGRPGDESVVEWQGRQFLVVQAWASHPIQNEVSDRRQKAMRLKLLVALETTRLQQTLAGHRRSLFAYSVIGVIFSTALAFVIAKRGLQPLHKMTELVRRLQVENLRPQFSNHVWPQELQPLGQEFDRLLGQVQHGLERLSYFSGNLAHELRTPLTSMMLETDVVLSQPRTPQEYVEILSSNMEELERLSSLIERLLLLSKTESSPSEGSMVELSILERLHRLIEYHWESVDRGDYHLSIPERAIVRFDARLFEMSAGNLLSNAFKYGKPPYQVVFHRVAGKKILSFIDSGPGISKEHLPFIFDRLYRVDSARQGTEGLGLGLALARSAMRSAAGDIRLAAWEGHCQFDLEFPDDEICDAPKT